MHFVVCKRALLIRAFLLLVSIDAGEHHPKCSWVTLVAFLQILLQRVSELAAFLQFFHDVEAAHQLAIHELQTKNNEFLTHNLSNKMQLRSKWR